MSHVIAIANQKGGVGKTTTAINLGASLAIAEKRTLIIDIDPQSNATSGLGVERRESLSTIYDVLIGDRSVDESILHGLHFPCLDLIPSTRDLVGAEIELVQARQRETILRRALQPIREQYDFVLVDCPPSLGLLTLNALAVSQSVLIPMQCEYYALQGLSHLLKTLKRVKKSINPKLKVEGILLTMYDNRNLLTGQVQGQVQKYFSEFLLKTIIPRNIRLSEAPSHGKPIVLYASRSKGSDSYVELAQEVIQRTKSEAAQQKTDPSARVA